MMVVARFGALRALVLALAGTMAMMSPAWAVTVKADYAITLAGLAIGHASLTGNFEDQRYTLKLDGQLTGIAGALSGGTQGAATSQGRVTSAGQLDSSGFAATGKTSSAQRTLQIGLRAGTVTIVEINPPFELQPDRIPLGEGDTRGVVDPLTAIVAVPANRARPLDPAACNRTLPIFEGTQRFDVVLSFAGREIVKKPGYDGEVLVCTARYVPIAGHRPLRPVVRFMADNKDISVWLAPAEGGRVLVPVRISVATMLGTTLIDAQSVQLGGAGPRPAEAAPTR